MLYEKPVWQLIADAAAALDEPFSKADLLAWFAEHYPNVKESTLSVHIIGLTANDRTRRHYPSLSRKHPVLFKVARGQFDRYDPDRHGTWGRLGEPLSRDASEFPETTDQSLPGDEEQPAREVTTDSLEFALEAYLEEFLLTNWDRIDWQRPLALWEQDGETGNQYATPVGRLDFLCRDMESDALVVVELKRGRPADTVVGQVARYMGWVRQHLAAPDQQVEGIIIAQEADDRVTYAASAVPGLSVLLYEVSFRLDNAPTVSGR